MFGYFILFVKVRDWYFIFVVRVRYVRVSTGSKFISVGWSFEKINLTSYMKR